jgi:hypothetical protein
LQDVLVVQGKRRPEVHGIPYGIVIANVMEELQTTMQIMTKLVRDS